MNKTVFNIQAEAATDQIRTESYLGREYLVVPCVALVEGVLHSANAAHPELALASEFGRYPSAWDGRPLVMNHPKVNGQYVSANSPAVLRDWSFGMLFNTQLDGSKLKTEAWIDMGRVNELGGEFASTVERIQSGQVVELSTGLFASVEETPGRYQGLDYAGVWRSVAPDHLAFLSEGTLGACSVADGCGVPRINMFRHVKPNKEDCGCGCGGTCNNGEPAVAKDHDHTHTHTHTHEGDAPQVNEHVLSMFAELGVQQVDGIDPEILEQVSTRQNKMAERFGMLIPNALPVDMPFENAQKLVRNKLSEACDLFAIYTMTSEVVVYETWDSMDLWQRTYTISEDGSMVTLGAEQTKVNLLTKVVPVTNSQSTEAGEDDESKTEDEDEMNRPNQGQSTSSEGEPVMSKDNGNGATEVTTGDVTTSTPATPTTPAVNEAPKVLTTAEYIAQAPAEVREVLQESMKLHADKKASLVANLKANDRCDYTEDELKAMSVGDLERLAKLANVPVTYAPPSAPRTNASDDSKAPAPLLVFEQKTSGAAA